METKCDDESPAELNNILAILATVFPRISPEVLREVIQTFDGESRLQIAAEQLLKYQDQWVRGRWRTDIAICSAEVDASGSNQQLLTAADRFRTAEYKRAARRTLCEEFSVLSKSKVEAVLAEENFCYSRTRSTLEKLASKSWRIAFHGLLARWQKSTGAMRKSHHLLSWPSVQNGQLKMIPILRKTGNAELDSELHQQILQPLVDAIRKQLEADDWDAAVAMNEAEAKGAGAMYECECCYLDTTFEQIAFCTTGGHANCFRCIWNAVNEALFGQSWGRTIEHDRGQIRCLAPVSTEFCQGCVPQEIARRAILQSRAGEEVLAKLESRLTEHAISRSGLPLVHCPSCIYVEVDELFFPPQVIRYRLKTDNIKLTCLLMFAMFNFVPLALLYIVFSNIPPFQAFPHLTTMFSRSLGHLSRKNHLSRRFQCRSPSCGLQSCLSCLKVWHDPHICHESARLSLRTTVEAARTAALKRTCPCCGLGFVKDSGCNRLTCICGYSMCYVCRQGLGRGDGGEGYRHFCQHFRPAAGVCKQCRKCDLYKTEDDESLVRRAGVLAEIQWREKEGMMGVEGIGSNREDKFQIHSGRKDWTVQGLLDWWIARILTC